MKREQKPKYKLEIIQENSEDDSKRLITQTESTDEIMNQIKGFVENLSFDKYGFTQITVLKQ